jgi:hypothetical protein
MVGPTERIDDTLHALDNNYAMNLIALEDEDIRVRDKEEKIAEALMGRRDYPAGSVGIHKETYQTYIMTSDGWVLVARGEDGRHHLVH